MGNILDSYPQLFYRIARVVFYIGQHLWLAQMEFKVNPPITPGLIYAYWAYFACLRLMKLVRCSEQFRRRLRNLNSAKIFQTISF